MVEGESVVIPINVAGGKSLLFEVPDNRVLIITEMEVRDASGASNIITLTDEGQDLQGNSFSRQVWTSVVHANSDEQYTRLTNRKVISKLYINTSGSLIGEISGKLI